LAFAESSNAVSSYSARETRRTKMVWARRWLGSATGAEPSSDARAADAPSGAQSPPPTPGPGCDEATIAGAYKPRETIWKWFTSCSFSNVAKNE